MKKERPPKKTIQMEAQALEEQANRYDIMIYSGCFLDFLEVS